MFLCFLNKPIKHFDELLFVRFWRLLIGKTCDFFYLILINEKLLVLLRI